MSLGNGGADSRNHHTGGDGGQCRGRASPVTSEFTQSDLDRDRLRTGDSSQPDKEKRCQQDDGNEGDDPEDHVGYALAAVATAKPKRMN